jgi:hypothetical protein
MYRTMEGKHFKNPELAIDAVRNGYDVKLKGNVNRDKYLFCGTVDRLGIEGGYNTGFLVSPRLPGFYSTKFALENIISIKCCFVSTDISIIHSHIHGLPFTGHCLQFTVYQSPFTTSPPSVPFTV